MSEFLGIDIKTLYESILQFYKNVLINKILEVRGMDNCNDFPISTKVNAPIGTANNILEYKRD